jgi:hypothetical protein
MTPYRIEPATFRVVAQYATPRPTYDCTIRELFLSPWSANACLRTQCSAMTLDATVRSAQKGNVIYHLAILLSLFLSKGLLAYFFKYCFAAGQSQ